MISSRVVDVSAVASLALVCTLAATGCRRAADDELTASEARQALDESAAAEQAIAVTSGGIELTTDFTIGGALEEAAQEIKAFVESQLPCAEVTLSGGTLTIEYGALPGSCTYNGHTWSGSHSVTVTKNDEAEVLVEHVWADLSNGVTTVSGTADVTWSLADQTRHVVHELEWTKGGDTWVGAGDRLQAALPGGITEGFSVNGERSWTGDQGAFELAIDGVEMRWVDPVPQAGSYTLTTPKGKELTLSFARVDADTIEVTIGNGKRSFSFLVNQAGAVSGE